MNGYVTVAIPVRTEHAKFLPQALASIEAQTLRGFIGQVIVVNDTGKALSVEGAKLLATRGGEGASVARNVALEQVRTPFVVFLDADDLLVNTAVETMLRAYAAYPEASYIYGDAWTDSGDGKGPLYYAAPGYNRRFLIGERNIHNVTTLLPTQIAKAVGGFDEVTGAWEDWDFYIRLALAGYCGVKVPSPLILYRLATGQNRRTHGQKANDLIREVRERYADYIEGRKELMACCGGDAVLGKQLMGWLPPDAPAAGDALLEFTGEQTGKVSFRGPSGAVYWGANDAENKYARVQRGDVQNLVERGVWRLVPESAQRGQVPTAQAVPDVAQARRRADPPGVTVPRMETATELAARTTVTIPKPCTNCGHITNFHSPDGCQALLANEQVCSCRQFVAEQTEKSPDDSRRAAPGKRPARRNARAAA